MARTSDHGSHIVTSAGIAVPVLQIAPGTQVPLASAAGLAASPAASRFFPLALRSYSSVAISLIFVRVALISEETALLLLSVMASLVLKIVTSLI